MPCIFAGNLPAKPALQAYRTDMPPVIDGLLDDAAWVHAGVAGNFIKRYPVFNEAPSFGTTVKILYDDKAVYVGAYMHDSSPDSIKTEMAIRDNDGKNADYFYILFDTYNNTLDAYSFGVSAAGTQIDSRIADATYDAVWSSAVKINKDGWVAELRIPYSALRFPAKTIQEWGMQIKRFVRRYREEDQWALEPKDADNNLHHWGSLTGLENINPPLRLSVLPYLSASLQKDDTQSEKDNKITSAFNGGMDLKWGLNESFTLDMILLPDFSQVQSDNQIKNLSPFEVQYGENRAFFMEGTDLFQKGGLFYSRRIGHMPVKYYSVNQELEVGESIIANPHTSRLLNAVKVSGRTSKGLGIGVFNAISGNNHAVVEDSLGDRREILTDPLTNYNIVVLDQSLPNKSSAYLINTNVTRPQGWKRSNVTGGGFRLSEKAQYFVAKLDLSTSKNVIPLSHGESEGYQNKTGLYYYGELAKIKGKFRFNLYQSFMNSDYDKNDLGVNNTNDWVDRGVSIAYNIYEPFSVFRNISQSIHLAREERYSTNKNINTALTYKFSATFLNYLSIWSNLTYSPYNRYDYYEPRKTGAVWIMPGYTGGTLSFSTDYRKVIAFDGDIDISGDFDNTIWKYYRLQPIIRLSDKLKLVPETELQLGFNDKGFVNKVMNASVGIEEIVFGNRDIQTITNALSGEYLFSKNIALSLWVRHYWQKGKYDDYLLLQNDGSLSTEYAYSGDANYNFNNFNIDLNFSWEFSPGSLLSVAWKNAIQNENQQYLLDYGSNFRHMVSTPQLNNLNVKLLYYLDYQMVLNQSRKTHECHRE